jgi:hypothetical protein
MARFGGLLNSVFNGLQAARVLRNGSLNSNEFHLK